MPLARWSQDDVLPGTLTVYEYLLFNAWLRLGSKTKSNSSSTDGPADRLTMQQRATRRRQAEQRRQMVVAQIIRELGLSKVAHSFIGDAFVRGLSGAGDGLSPGQGKVFPRLHRVPTGK